MARQLWLLRHGDAEPHGSREDAERRLTERGERQSDAAGRALAALGPSFSQWLTSPRVRALDTARIAASHLSIEPVVHESLSTGFEAEEARELIAGLDDGEALMIVGHEPDLSRVVYDLTGARVDMKKGGIAAVRFDGSQPQLTVLLRPREIAALAEAVGAGLQPALDGDSGSE
jgi:phosphohistidine phosphatase